MNRGQMRLEVRRALGELTEATSLFTNAEIDDWLNEAALIMCSIAQPYECLYSGLCSLQPGSSSEYLSEYVLPEDLDELFDVYLNDGGQEWQLKRIEHSGALQNTRVTGIPSRYYLRYATDQTGELRDGGITVRPITNSNGRGRMVLGLSPAPSQAFTFTVAYYGRHFKMTNDFDTPIIPPEYRRGLIKYAESLAREKDDDLETANTCRTHFVNFADQYKSRMINRGQETELPHATILDDEPLDGYIVHWSTG